MKNRSIRNFNWDRTASTQSRRSGTVVGQEASGRAGSDAHGGIVPGAQSSDRIYGHLLLPAGSARPRAAGRSWLPARCPRPARHTRTLCHGHLVWAVFQRQHRRHPRHQIQGTICFSLGLILTYRVEVLFRTWTGERDIAWSFKEMLVNLLQ